MPIGVATTAAQFAEIRKLLREYEAWLQIDLCFQNFEAELAGLPGVYAPPQGRLLIAEDGDRTTGCVALRPVDAAICEMKRLFVRPEFRGTGLGRRLALAAAGEAKAIGYGRMRLDTLPKMMAAQKLYRSLGFREIEPYNQHPIPGTRFLELDLALI